MKLASPWKVVKDLSLEAWVTSRSSAKACSVRAPVSWMVFLNVAIVLSPAVRDESMVLLTRVAVYVPIVGFVA